MARLGLFLCLGGVCGLKFQLVKNKTGAKKQIYICSVCKKNMYIFLPVFFYTYLPGFLLAFSFLHLNWQLQVKGKL